jgi:hypothetical protein
MAKSPTEYKSALKDILHKQLLLKERLMQEKWAQQIETAIAEGWHFKTAESKKRTLSELIDARLG